MTARMEIIQVISVQADTTVTLTASGLYCRTGLRFKLIERYGTGEIMQQLAQCSKN